MKRTYCHHLFTSLRKDFFWFAGARPTWYTHDAVLKTVIERDINNIIQLDPGISKGSLYQEYVYLYCWKIQTIAKGTIIKTSCCDVDDDEGWQQQPIQICSWGSFHNYWTKNYPN